MPTPTKPQKNPSLYQAEPWALVVEDDPEFREQVCLTLTKMRIRPVEARTTKEAWSKLQNQRFACVLLDMRLEKGTVGEEIIEMMREPEHGPHVQTPIIVMSGFLEQALVERISRRVDAVLVKPFTPEDLRKRIESVLQAAASRKGKS